MKKVFKLLALAVLVGVFSAFIANPPKDDPSKRSKGLDLSGMDLSVNPRDNFYLYANGSWLKKTEIPASETGWGSFNTLRDDNQKNLKTLLMSSMNDKNAAQGSIERRVGDFFASGMDSVAIEKLGYEPIKAILAEVDAIKDYKSLLTWATTHPTEGGLNFLGIGVGADPKNPDVHIVSMRQSGTGLPEKDYYTKTDSATIKVREAYKKYMTQLQVLTGTSADVAKQNAENIIALEAKLAASHLTRIEQRNPLIQYNKFSVNDFSAKVPELDLPTLLKNLHLTTDTILVAHPKYYQELSKLIVSEPVDIWKTKLRIGIISGVAPYLSSPFVKANFDYVGRTLNGLKTQQERWKRISSMTDNTLGDLLGQLYVAKYFTPQAKKRMDELVANLRVSLEKHINALEWMSAGTKTEAIKKLNAFTPKIGYPTKWKKYEGVDLKRDNYFGNIRALSKWRWEENVARLGKPVDKTEWGMTPPTVNAYYNPLRNEIAFPAGILQWPFFDPTADDAFNYGAIGAVIGHEMTHGFDDSGRQYNYAGMLKNWWKDEDAEQFKKRAQMVIDQYDGFTVLDGLHVKGQLTLGENLADFGGISVSYDAFKMTKEGQSTEKIDGFTPDQRFFLAFAQMWRTKTRDEALRLRVNTDPHSPGEFRTNGPLSNFEPFYKAFNVQPGDKMYRADDKRAKIW